MAAIADRVIVELEAKIDRYNANVRAAEERFNTATRGISANAKRMERDIGRSTGEIGNQLRRLAGSFAAAFTAQRVVALADQYTRFTNQLRLAGLSGSALVGVQQQLFAIAQRQGVPLEALGTLYGRASATANELGASQAQLIQFTAGVAAALRVQGGSAEQAQGALMQLSQALGGGIVRAEEFNSIMEGARPIAAAVAKNLDGMGGSVARLRAAVVEGKVSSQDFFNAFLRGSAELEAQAARSSLTIGASFTVLNNALGMYIGQADDSLSATERMSAGIVALSHNLDTVATALGVLAAVLTGRVVAGLITTAGTTGLVSTAIFAMQARALGAATTMEALALTGATAGRTLLAAFGGPIGVAVAALTLGIMYFATRTGEAKHDVEQFKEQGEKLADQMVRLNIAGRTAAGTLTTIGNNANVARGQMLAFAGSVGEAALRLQQLATQRRQQLLDDFRQSYRDARTEREAAEARIAGRAQSETSVARFGRLPTYSGPADAADRAIADAARRREDQARAGFQQTTRTPLPGFLVESEREGRDVSGELVRVTQDLVIARRAANRQQIQLLEAQKYELDQYKKYRTSGLSPTAAREASQRDMSRFQGATREGNARREASGSGADNWGSPQQAIQWLGSIMQQRGMTPRENFAFGRVGEHPGMGRQQHGERAIDVSGSDAQIRAMIATAQAEGFRALYKGWVYEAGRNGQTRRIPANQNQHNDHGHFEAPRNITKRNRPDGEEGSAAFDESLLAAERAAADARTQRQQTLEAEQGRLADALLQARRALVLSAEEQEQLARQEVTAARDRYSAELDRQVARGNEEEARVETRTQITAAEAEVLRATNAQVVTLQLQAIDLERRRRRETDAANVAERALAAQAGDLERRQEVIQTQSQMATTAAERRRLELELLDLQMQEQRLRLRALVAAADRVLASESTATAEQRIQAAAEREAAMRGLEQVDRLEPARREQVRQGTRGPAEEYLDSLRKTKDQINEEFEQIAVNGAKKLEDSLTNSIASVFKLGGAFGEVANQIIADLIRIVVQQALIRPLAELMGSEAGIGGPAGGLMPGAGSQGGGWLKGLLQLGATAASAYFGRGSGSMGALSGGSAAIGMASGGHVAAGRLVRVNETGVEGWQPAQSGKIIPLGRMRHANSGQTVVRQTFVLDARYGITTPELLQHVNRIATRKAAEAGSAAFGASLSAAPGYLAREDKLRG